MTDLRKLKWTDTSTADPIEKARRVLNHLIEPNVVFFFGDGFPRCNEIAMNAASVLAVLNALSASIADTAKPVIDKSMVKRLMVQYGLDKSHESIADTAGAKAVAWAVYNGVCIQAFFKSEETASRYAIEMQKNHDLSGSLAAFVVKPLYAAPPAPSVADAAGARTTLNYDGTVDITCAHCGGNGCFACLRKESGND